MPSVTIQVPATTANLGPGYDCMGIALRLYNRIIVSRAASGTKAGPPDAMADEAAEAFFKASGSKPFRFAWSISGEVPRSRGLGSSVTVRLGILHGLNDLAGGPLTREEVFHCCAELEGHPDNAAPAAFGGFTIAARGCALQRYRVDPCLEFVLLIPGFEIPTPRARKILPAKVAFADATENAARAAAIAGAFASRNYSCLKGAFGDRLHQPSRLKLVPFLHDVVDAGVGAGALGGWLSGSGSSVACATLGPPENVAAAMLSACGLQHASVVTARADNSGVRIIPKK
jgi:homoserine kinase